MPELPEVETTRRGIAPAITDRRIAGVEVREPRLRWRVNAELDRQLAGQRFRAVTRRGKYLLLDTGSGVLMIHLGMSGSLRIVPAGSVAGKHDHCDIRFDHGLALRFTDPRRFGAILWLDGAVEQHPLLCHLGPEPLEEGFDGGYLKKASHGKRVAVKNFIMDGTVVVGVGNIYANEALFQAGIHPARPAGRISLARYECLAGQIKEVLNRAIQVGGTTLRDFTGGDGKPGYFRQSLLVYGRGGEPCRVCNTTLKERRLGQRSTVYCRNCQV